jgi:hypothetical protein
MKKMRVIDTARSCLLLAATSLLVAETYARTWTSADGTKTFEGEFESYDAAKGMVTVALPDGQAITFNQDKLSKADIAFLREDATGAAPSSPPEVKEISDSPPETVGGDDDGDDPSEPWAYLDNGTIRIGVDKRRGTAIGYLALSSTNRNLLNHHDEGRFIQQSYYGDPDGSLWAKNPWVYNPVQGGSYKGEDARTLEFRKSRDELHAKIEPLHWASAKPCPEAIMQEWITLDGPVARIRMRMEYSGPTQQRNAHQELPAMFVDFALPHLMFELDGKLVKHAPVDLGKDLKPENIRYDTEWLAFVDDDGFGIGIHTPGTDQAVTYRHRGNGSTGPDGSACSYVAPVRTMQLKKGTVVDYHFHLTIGTLDEIRRRFAGLAGKTRGER